MPQYKIVIAAILLAVFCSPLSARADDPASDRVGWLRDHAIPIDTAEAEHGFADLAPWRDLIGDARIVALGECTHGSREVFQMKHRLVEYLATELGFTIFAIEASTPEAQAVSDYTLRGEGDPAQLIDGMYFWTWRTEEVLAMVEWMRRYNGGGKGPLSFTGFDMQTPTVAVKNVVGFLEEVAPVQATTASGQYAGLDAVQLKGSPFGVVTDSFPVEPARGKTVCFSGWIRTQDVVDGWAGLWWRADGPDHKVLAFDNMMNRGPRGTTDWQRYEVTLAVPPQTVNINFGGLLTGKGAAWFDDLAVTLDGAPHDGAEFDFGFEGDYVRAYASNDAGYTHILDAQVAHGGARSLKLWSVAKQTAAPDPAAVVRAAGAVVAMMETSRDEYLRMKPANEVDWAIHNAHIVHQDMLAIAGDYRAVRDSSMAENVAWILEQNPGARIVLWAHNGHVGRGKGQMGEHLARRFGKDYVPVGFATGGGQYYAKGRGATVIHDLQAPPAGSFEASCMAIEQPRFVVDLREASDAARLDEPLPLRSIGAMATDEQFAPCRLRDEYDLLIYLDRTTAARQLPR